MTLKTQTFREEDDDLVDVISNCVIASHLTI